MDIKLLLAPRIEKHCRGLLESGEYKHAAREALVQVELALRGRRAEGQVLKSKILAGRSVKK